MPAPNSIAPSRATPTCSRSGRSRVKERNSIPTSVPLPMVSASQANQPCVAPPPPDPRSGEIVSASVRASVAQAVASVAASPNTRATLRRTPNVRAASATAPGPDAAATVPRASTAGRRGGVEQLDPGPEHDAEQEEGRPGGEHHVERAGPTGRQPGQACGENPDDREQPERENGAHARTFARA